MRYGVNGELEITGFRGMDSVPLWGDGYGDGELPLSERVSVHESGRGHGYWMGDQGSGWIDGDEGWSLHIRTLGRRVEVVPRWVSGFADHRPGLLDYHWYRWDMKLGELWPEEDPGTIVAQWVSPEAPNPSLAMELHGNRIRFRVRGPEDFAGGTHGDVIWESGRIDEWEEYAVSFQQGESGGEGGFVELWRNGESIFSGSGLSLGYLDSESGPVWKYGIYNYAGDGLERAIRFRNTAIYDGELPAEYVVRRRLPVVGMPRSHVVHRFNRRLDGETLLCELAPSFLDHSWKVTMSVEIYTTELGRTVLMRECWYADPSIVDRGEPESHGGDGEITWELGLSRLRVSCTAVGTARCQVMIEGYAAGSVRVIVP